MDILDTVFLEKYAYGEKLFWLCSLLLQCPLSFEDVTSLHEVWMIDCSLVLQHRVVSAINK